MSGSSFASQPSFISRDPEVTDILSHTDGHRAASARSHLCYLGMGTHLRTRGVHTSVCTQECILQSLQVTRGIPLPGDNPSCLEVMVIITVRLLKF